MDNPQHYQPLSHALYPPLTTSPHLTNLASGSGSGSKLHEHAHEDMDDGEEDDDEGMVEEQLHENDAGELQYPNSSHTSPGEGGGDRTGSTEANGHANGAQTERQEGNPPPKRRPGRPRGSKNRSKGKSVEATSATIIPASSNQQQPSAPTNVNPQNQQYYEFQWRVLNLCAEFYGAAEELVKGTPPLVIAQSYHMGPSIKVDPLTMLNDAKRVCDTLLANPSQLTTSPPPPIHPQFPTFPLPQIPSPSSSASATGKFSAKPASVITNAQSFTMPLAAPSLQPPVQFPYPQQNQAPYQTMPYYSQPYVGVPYVPNSTAPSASGSVPPQVNAAASGSAGAQGSWTDEEESRLKQLAEQSKSIGSTGEIEWDWVVNQWGPNRTRHQILIKATALGLKASSTRGQKRRRGSTHGMDADGTPAATTSASAPTSGVGGVVIAPAPSTTSSISQPASAQPSPALQHSRPPSQTATSVSRLAWPAPVVAADTASPIIMSSSAQQQQQQQQDSQRPYYRPEASLKPDSLSSHHYVYQPNGKGGAGSKFSKQNGR